VTVQVNSELEFAIVPEVEHLVEVNLTTLVFHCPNQTIPPINNAPDNAIYRIEEKDPAVAAPNSLQVVQYVYEEV
jgi:hypothetical protein